MATLKIIEAGAPILKETAKPVEHITKHIKKLLDDMAETMYAAEGVGLAGPQVNESLQLVVLDDGNGLIELINPEIIERSEETDDGETVITVEYSKNGRKYDLVAVPQENGKYRYYHK